MIIFVSLADGPMFTILHHNFYSAFKSNFSENLSYLRYKASFKIKSILYYSNWSDLPQTKPPSLTSISRRLIHDSRTSALDLAEKERRNLEPSLQFNSRSDSRPQTLPRRRGSRLRVNSSLRPIGFNRAPPQFSKRLAKSRNVAGTLFEALPGGHDCAASIIGPRRR